MSKTLIFKNFSIVKGSNKANIKPRNELRINTFSFNDINYFNNARKVDIFKLKRMKPEYKKLYRDFIHNKLDSEFDNVDKGRLVILFRLYALFRSRRNRRMLSDRTKIKPHGKPHTLLHYRPLQEYTLTVSRNLPGDYPVGNELHLTQIPILIVVRKSRHLREHALSYIVDRCIYTSYTHCYISLFLFLVTNPRPY